MPWEADSQRHLQTLVAPERKKKMDAWVTWQMGLPESPSILKVCGQQFIRSLQDTVWWIWKGLRSSVTGHSQHAQQEPEAQEWDLMGMDHLNKQQHGGRAG